MIVEEENNTLGPIIVISSETILQKFLPLMQTLSVMAAMLLSHNKVNELICFGTALKYPALFCYAALFACELCLN